VKEETSTDRKRLLKRTFKKAERKAEIDSSPLAPSELRTLLEAVSRLVLHEHGRVLCDHTHRFTRQSLGTLSMDDADRVISFLDSKGFHCDCEVALNLGSWLAWNAPEGRGGTS
jgi:uncharacterized protein DUF2695